MKTDITDLFAVFSESPPTHVNIEPAKVPQPYHSLLVQPDHMTVTVERFFGCPVSVQVLVRKYIGMGYARMILLAKPTGEIVQFGIMRIRLDLCSNPVREAIMSEQVPLGRILIENDVMRSIEPTSFFRVELSPPMSDWFGQTGTTYGRTGVILLEGQPSVELCEILAPIQQGSP